MTSLTQLLEEIEARVSKATKGEWAGIDFLADREVKGELAICMATGPADQDPHLFGIMCHAPLSDNDQKFISAARTDIPRLIQAVKVLSEANDWYWANWGSSRPDVKAKGYHVSKDALDQATKILKGDG